MHIANTIDAVNVASVRRAEYRSQNSIIIFHRILKEERSATTHEKKEMTRQPIHKHNGNGGARGESWESFVAVVPVYLMHLFVCIYSEWMTRVTNLLFVIHNATHAENERKGDTNNNYYDSVLMPAKNMWKRLEMNFPLAFELQITGFSVHGSHC